MSKPNCKVCRGPLAAEIDRRIGIGQSNRKLESLAASLGVDVSRETVRKHRPHAEARGQAIRLQEMRRRGLPIAGDAAT